MKTVEEDVRCGQHSGFPPCCIAFYVGPWRLLCATIPSDLHVVMEKVAPHRYASIELVPSTASIARFLAAKARRTYSKWAEEGARGVRAGYIRCPACVLRGRVVEVKKCDCVAARKKKAEHAVAGE